VAHAHYEGGLVAESDKKHALLRHCKSVHTEHTDLWSITCVNAKKDVVHSKKSSFLLRGIACKQTSTLNDDDHTSKGRNAVVNVIQALG
jgi:hypothetical protein